MPIIGGNVSYVELAFPSSFLKDISALSDNRYFSSRLNEADCFIKVKKSDQEPLGNDPLIFLLFSFPTKDLSKNLLKNKSALLKWHFSKLSETSAEEIDKHHTQDGFSGKELKESLVPSQRKRGRPKNSTKPKLPIPTIEEPEINSTVGRYSLRGVKLSSKIMKLEMEEPDDNFESESDNDAKPITKEVVVNDFQKEFLKFDGSKDEINKILDNQQNQKCSQEMDSEVGIGDVHVRESELDKTRTNLKQNHSELNTLCEVAAMERAVTVEYATDLTVHIDPLDNTTEERQEILCNLCPKSETFESKKELRLHENAKHKDLTCLFCETPDKKYKHIYSLRGHVLTMHGENASAQNHLCHLCTASYKFASTLKQHIEEIHEGIYKFECDICQKKFYRNSQLNRHKKIHGDSEQKLKCNVCEKGFWHEFNLQRHVRLLHNTQSEQFHCSYCGRPFSQKASMISHVQRVHFKLFKFKCDLCDLSFEQSKELLNHMSHLHDKKDFELPQQKPTHNKYLKTPDEMFCCPTCTKRFFYKAELIVHIYSFHADTFPFKCRFCPQGFLRRSYLSRHRNVTHKEELTAEEEEELTLEMSSENLATDVTGNGEVNCQGGVEYLEEIDMNLNNEDQEYVLVQAAAGQDAEDSSLLEHSENVTYIYDYDKDNEGSSTVDSSNEIVTSGSEPMMIDVEDDGQTIRYLIQPSEDGKSQTFKADEFAKFIVAANNNEFEILNESEVKVVGSIEVVETFKS